MILKEHPIKYTATEIRRAIPRLETWAELNPKDAEQINVKCIIDGLRDVWNRIPKEFRK